MIVVRDRRTFLVVWVADFFVLLGAFFVMQDRYQLAKARVITASAPAAAPSAPPLVSTEAVLAAKPPEDPYTDLLAAHRAPPEPIDGPRRIGFSYRDSRPARVEIVGSFNNWTPHPLVKGVNHVWTLTLALDPGEYTYNFLVDGKAVRDPNNPRSGPEGRSLLLVRPRPPS